MKKSLLRLENKYLFLLGLLGVSLLLLPYLFLGEGAIVPYHDQLDGELLAYIYQAKYWFQGNVIPEFLGGMSKSALIPPAPLAVLLFKLLHPFAALVTMQGMGQIIAYVGMFRLAELVSGKKLIAFVAALFYSFLPFLPVYGLSQYGMPMLLLSIFYLYKGEKVKRSLFYVACYAAMSSLVLCGFAWLGLWFAGLVALICKGKAGKHRVLFAGFAVLLGVYVLENLTLLGQMLGLGESYISHKKEYAISGGDFLPTFWEYFLYNGEHSKDSHIWIIVLAVVVLVFYGVFRKKWGRKISGKIKKLLMTLGALVILCLLAAVWDCGAFVPMKQALGTLGTLQLDRVLWLAPMLWLLVFVFCADILWDVPSVAKWFVYGGLTVLLAGVAVVTLKNSLVKPCVQKLLRPDYEAMSYSDYLAVGVLEQVEEFIRQEKEREKEEYRVASLGIDPAAALYHGFYSVDGYSNNYALEYKHAFRQVIAPELEKSEYLKGYFDDWGNRCYLFSSECPGYYTIEKGGFVFQNLELDLGALKELGCEYVLSAAYIMDAEQKGLLLLRGEAFETPDSYYKIFLYALSE